MSGVAIGNSRPGASPTTWHSSRSPPRCRIGAMRRPDSRCGSCAGLFTAEQDHYQLGDTTLCGIVAYVGSRDSVPILLEGLARLEYRGYDSAGIAVVGRGGDLRVHKAKGRVPELAADVPPRLKGSPGIGHTRWATHGVPSDTNAHPHVCGPIAVVHNGIIENADELRSKLIADGAEFTSETDSEIFAHLIAAYSAPEDDSDGKPRDLEEAVRLALQSVVGTYGLAVLDARSPDRLVVARNGSPVLLG